LLEEDYFLKLFS